ncbi:hypothetical protein [Streptomyces sp. NPDC012510]|uniref:hypothetical protein n=1 Tax=Streptomyces sp. NPDC012510 TaxID=3364838 RepID=UPI0036F0102D
MTNDDLPDQQGAGIRYLSCEWCGQPVSQLGTRTPRRYCRRSHRQRAYEARRLQRASGVAPAALPPAGESAVALLDLGDLPLPAPAGGEECPYCREDVVGLVAHLRQCRERPGAAMEDRAAPRPPAQPGREGPAAPPA